MIHVQTIEIRAAALFEKEMFYQHLIIGLKKFEKNNENKQLMIKARLT